MDSRQYLQIPGPTNIPERVLRSLSRPLINHRGPEFAGLLDACLDGLRSVFRTGNDILIFPSAGSGVLESAVANLFSAGDRIVVGSMGLFSERMAVIAGRYGLAVQRIAKEWGLSVQPCDVRSILEDDHGRHIKAVCVPQHETTTGVVNEVEGIARAMSELGHPAILIVDAVSSLACLPLETDAWGIDVVVSASQKGLMLPPGLGMVAVGARAWALAERAGLPKWYWDYQAVRNKLRDHQLPYTPPTTLLFGLREALAMLEEEGIENTWRRHAAIGHAVRSGVTAMGLGLLAEEGCRSDAVTAIRIPDGIHYEDLAEMLRAQYHVIIGEGLERLRGRIFRIGHMGAIHCPEVFAILGSVELALHELGCPVELGSANRAAAQSFAQAPKASRR
jgi:alanine-glyoxylate transaminase/serine-glyoxylate transaminase/serine-pyruvate transaminase